MKPTALHLAAALLLAPALLPHARAQSPLTDIGASGAHSSQLILWSQAEQPKRVPIPLPLAKPTPRPRTSSNGAANSSMQTFVGTIAKDKSGRRYVLAGSEFGKTSGLSELQLDNQVVVGKFVGSHVKLEGFLDETQSRLQILTIQSN